MATILGNFPSGTSTIAPLSSGNDRLFMQTATYDATPESHTFDPGFAVEEWQVRLINGSGSNTITFTVFAVDEDGVPILVKSQTLTVSSGLTPSTELTIITRNPKIKVTGTGTSPSATVKVKAYIARDSSLSDGASSYGTPVAAA